MLTGVVAGLAGICHRIINEILQTVENTDRQKGSLLILVKPSHLVLCTFELRQQVLQLLVVGREGHVLDAAIRLLRFKGEEIDRLADVIEL